MSQHSTIRNNKPTCEEKMLLLLDRTLKEDTARIAYKNHMTANAFVREAIRRNIREYQKAALV
jgi:RNase P protein component